MTVLWASTRPPALTGLCEPIEHLDIPDIAYVPRRAVTAGIVFVPFGRFGAAVGAVLQASGAVSLTIRQPSASAPVPRGCRAVVTAGSVPLEGVQAAIAACGVPGDLPWLPVTLEPRQFTVGPWIAAGIGCLDCLRAREAQHDGTGGRFAVARAALAGSASPDLWAHLPGHARIAAAIAAGMAAEIIAGTVLEPGAGPRPRSRVIRCQLGGAQISSHELTPRAGCPTCRPQVVHRTPLGPAVRATLTGGESA